MLISILVPSILESVPLLLDLAVGAEWLEGVLLVVPCGRDACADNAGAGDADAGDVDAGRDAV